MTLPGNDSRCKRRSELVFLHFFLLLIAVLSARSLYAQAPRSVTTSVTPTQGGAVATTTVGGTTAAAYHPSRVLVHFRAGIRDFLPGSGPARAFPGDADLFLVTNPPGLAVPEVMDRYRANPNVLYAEPDFEVHAIAINPPPNDPLWPQWDMTKISAPDAWDLQTSVSSVNTIVAIVDTGIDPTHEDLQGNLYADVNGHPGFSCFGSCVAGGEDDYGHGTHVAGTIGAVANNGKGMAGLNWSIQMISFKFLNSGGSGYISDAVLAFQKILELKTGGMNIRLTSNSWGGGGYSDALRTAMINLANVGTVHVCAAGNSNVNADVSPMYPAAYDDTYVDGSGRHGGGIISVLATDSSDVGASFTNYGLASVDIAAPGVSTLSTVPIGTCALCVPVGSTSPYKLLSGTSMATPHVTGVLAAMIEKRATLVKPPLSAAEARDIILNPNSYDWMTNLKAQSTSTGGRLNFYKALTNPLLSSSPFTLNRFPSLTVGPDIFTAPNTPVVLSASASDPDGDALRGAWGKEGASAGSAWLMGWWLGSLIPNPSGNPATISIPSFSLPMVSPFGIGYADNRGGGAYGRTVVTTTAGSAGTPPSESLTLSATDIAVGDTITINMPASGSGTIARDVWASGKSGASGWCCYTTSAVNMTFNSAGVYRIGSQAMDSNLGLSNRPTAVVRVGGATAETPLLSYTLDKTSGNVPFTVNIDMSGSTPPAGGTISYYYFICNGGGFTAGSTSAKGSCTYTKPGAYWIMLELQGSNQQVDIASAYVVATPVPPTGATSTALASSLNPSTYGQSVTFTATVTPASGPGTPTGSVTFYDGASVLGSGALNGSGQATYTTSSLSGGSHSITATYGGDSTYSGSTSPPLSQTVSKASTSTALASSLNPSTFGQSVTFTATVSPSSATGTAQFFDGVSSLGTASLSGGQASLATAALSVGSHSITATYNGDGNFSGSTSFALTQTVNPAPNFTVSASPASQTAARSSSTQYTVTVTPAAGFTGNVTLSVTGVPPQSSGSFNTNPVSITSPSSGSSTLTVNVGKNTPKKTYTLTIKGASGSLSSSTNVSLVVQ